MPHLKRMNWTLFATLGLLILSNIVMTFAWYGHLKLQQMGVTSHWPLIGVIVFSWAIAFFEYMLMVPANRLGFDGNGGPFSLLQLKVIQEVITLTVKVLCRNDLTPLPRIVTLVIRSCITLILLLKKSIWLNIVDGD